MLIPNKGRVVVKPLIEKEATTRTGFVLLNINPRETAIQAEVKAVAEDSPCQVGQILLIPPFAGDALRREEDGKFVEYRIIRTDSILAFL